VFNQFTEQFSINELAELVKKAGSEVGLDVAIENVANPRVEKEQHYYNAKHEELLKLGLEPHLLSETLVGHMFDVIRRNRDRVITDHILPRTTWRAGVPTQSADSSSALADELLAGTMPARPHHGRPRPRPASAQGVHSA
jgi:hypothetical protein